jgi:ribosomal protein S18 acetylase RimI-like enzyme
MIRQLEPLEWLKLQETFIREFAEPLPDPNETRIFGIVEGEGENEKIVGFLQVETAIHIRHICLEPEHRGQGKAEALADYVRALFRNANKRAHLIATSRFAERLAEHVGMKRIDGTLWEGDGR